MIKQLYVDNYKCLVNFKLPLRELSLLLGPSGVGKTSVLDIMFALRRLLSGDARVTDPDTFPTQTLTRWQSRDRQVFEIQALLNSWTFTYHLEVDHERATRRARVHVERLLLEGKPLFECKDGEVQLYRDDHTKGPSYSVDWSESPLARVASRHDNIRLTSFLDFMRRVLVCSPYPPRFRTVSADEAPLLARDARNFADWYRHGIQEHPGLVAEYTRTLREVIGHGFEEVRLEKVGHEARALTVAIAKQANSPRYDLRFDEISDGQRALVLLYSLIHMARDQGYTLFLDEPDNYVALREIQPWLMGLEDACGNTVAQAVISSHHPELIDYLGRENGVLLLRETSGAIIARLLNDDSNETEGGVELSELFARGWES